MPGFPNNETAASSKNTSDPSTSGKVQFYTGTMVLSLILLQAEFIF
jgi:hypothetical protein